jgi:hypothetical protein
MPLPRVDVAEDRIVRQVAGLRPFPSGFVVRIERLGDKTVIYNYGHGGCGVTLSGKHVENPGAVKGWHRHCRRRRWGTASVRWRRDGAIPSLLRFSFPQPPQPRVSDHPQADRRREPDGDRERLLEDRMLRVERRGQEHADEHRYREIVQEGRGQLHLLIVNEVRHAKAPPAGAAVATESRSRGDQFY